jgi:hypothetical protein
MSKKSKTSKRPKVSEDSLLLYNQGLSYELVGLVSDYAQIPKYLETYEKEKIPDIFLEIIYENVDEALDELYFERDYFNLTDFERPEEVLNYYIRYSAEATWGLVNDDGYMDMDFNDSFYISTIESVRKIPKVYLAELLLKYEHLGEQNTTLSEKDYFDRLGDEYGAFDVIRINLCEDIKDYVMAHYQHSMKEILMPHIMKTSLYLDSEEIDNNSSRVTEVLDFYVSAYKKISSLKLDIEDFNVTYEGTKIIYNVLSRLMGLIDNVDFAKEILRKKHKNLYSEIMENINKHREEFLLIFQER